MVMTLATSPAKMSFTPALASSPGRLVKLPPAVLTDMQSPANAGAA